MKRNIYTVVTNDDLETVVRENIIGLKALADFLGYTESYVTKCVFYNRWSRFQKYKAYKSGEKRPAPVENKTKRKCRDLSKLSPEEKKELNREYQREYQKKYRKENQVRLKQYHRQWYIEKIAKEYK